MNDEEFRLLDEIEESHWWFIGKRHLLRALLEGVPHGDRLLDLGCGTGGALRELAGEVWSVGVDRSELALRICADKGQRILVRGKLDRLPFRGEAFDTILLLDVLEHLEDDVGFLRGVRCLCRREGRIVISVPAFQFLWSQHDEAFEHRRRYSASQLEAVVREAGLHPERMTYTNALVFPFATVWRLLSYRLGLGRFAAKHDFWTVPGWMNGLIVLAYRMEARWLRRFDAPIGVSIVCIARASPV